MPTGKLTPQETAHAKSIADSQVILAPIPPIKIPRVLIGSVIRKRPEILEGFLGCLAAQQLRKPTEIGYCFITDFAPTDDFAQASQGVLAAFADGKQRVAIRQAGNAGGDFSDNGGTHQWTSQAWHRVGALKNQILQVGLTEGYDAIWLIDADVMCDPFTLQSLADCEVPIVAGVYWTQWQTPKPNDNLVIHAGPQVWLRHPYELSGHGYSEAEFRQALVHRQLLRVWGLGACTLLHRSAVEKGVHFTPVPEGLPPGPMSDGEDRHLCERARRLHLPLFADPWPDIWHCYHPEDIASIGQWRGRFSQPRNARAGTGDLVSARLDLLEPIPHPNNPGILQHLGPQFYRGRIGMGGVLPEIEDALGEMTRGERRIVQLHYPGHYEYATLRGQSRLIALTMLDHKPYHVPPTIERELFVSVRTGAWKDATTLTERQITSMTETAVAI